MAKPTNYILMWNGKSMGARSLAKYAGLSRIDNIQKDQDLSGSVLVNWGCTKTKNKILDQFKRVLNPPAAIDNVVNKLFFFQHLADQPLLAPRVPEWTTDSDDALEWLAKGEEVLGRAMLKGRGGSGIIFGSDKQAIEDFIDCSLFVKYKKKKDEYRVHFLAGQEIDIQQKLLRKVDETGQPIDPNTVDYRIRSYNNGFIFARKDIDIPKDVREQARKAYLISGLDFGAVDVIYNKKEDKAYVLEINSAPGLMGTTLTRYGEALKKVLA